MRIGIDIRTVSDRTGKGVYTLNLVKHLLQIDEASGKNEYILYTNHISQEMAHFTNAHIKVIHCGKLMWHFKVIKDFKNRHGNIFFAPTSYIIPAFLPSKTSSPCLKTWGFRNTNSHPDERGSGSASPSEQKEGGRARAQRGELAGETLVSPGIKSIFTVHDLIAFLHPKSHHSKAKIIEKLLLKRAVKKAAAILVPSQNTKKDLVKITRCAPEKIAVTPLAAGEIFFKETDAASLASVKAKLNLPDNFILTVGGLEPRKNVATLADAFVEVSQKHPDLKLVIAGPKNWKSKNTEKKLAAFGDKIIRIENCGLNELAVFYKLAKLFVFPSIYEGFGLPPLEAMASGCPTACSNASSLPEVCGDAAVYFNPFNNTEIVQVINKLIEDPALQNKLKNAGVARAKQFSWESTAKKTLEAIYNIGV